MDYFCCLCCCCCCFLCLVIISFLWNVGSLHQDHGPRSLCWTAFVVPKLRVCCAEWVCRPWPLCFLQLSLIFLMLSLPLSPHKQVDTAEQQEKCYSLKLTSDLCLEAHSSFINTPPTKKLPSQMDSSTPFSLPASSQKSLEILSFFPFFSALLRINW